MGILLNSGLCKTFIFSFFMLVGVIDVFAQDSHTSSKKSTHKTIDELVHLLRTDSTKTDDYEKAILDYAILDQNTAKQWSNTGVFFYQKEQLDKSLIFFDKAIQLGSKLQLDDVVSRAYSIKGHIYLRKPDDQKALEAYYKAIEVAEKNGNVAHQILAKSGMIIVYQRTKRWKQGQELVSYMLDNIDKTPYANQDNHARIYTTINDFFLAQEAYDSVLHFANKGIALSEKLDFKEGLVDHHIKKGIVFHNQEKYEEAFEFLEKAQEILSSSDVDNIFYQYLNSNYFLASSYYHLEQYDQAITYALKNIEISKDKDQEKIEIIQTHLLLANCYREKKDFETALRWNDSYVKLRAAYEDKKDETVDVIFDKSAAELENEIATLKQEKKAEQIKKRIYIVLSILISLGLLIMGIQYYRRQKSNQKRFDYLMEQITKLEKEEILVQANENQAKEIVIDDEKVAAILKKLKNLEEKEYFLSPDCNLNAIAKKIKTNTTYLSKIINIHKGKSMKDYINDLRIEYALKKIKNDRKFRAFSIKSIATEVGYKSHNSFTKHFKTKDGVEPIVLYQKH